MIKPKAKEIIEETFQKALALLGFPSLPFVFSYERIGDGRFVNTEIGAEIESSNWTLHVNEDWANLAFDQDPFDLSFITSHEVRHFYQSVQINLFRNGKKIKEDRRLIISWINNNQHYQRNNGGDTTVAYHRQPVEVDADAFACFYVMYYGIGQPRMSDESDDLVLQRLEEIGNQYGLTIC